MTDSIRPYKFEVRLTDYASEEVLRRHGWQFILEGTVNFEGTETQLNKDKELHLHIVEGLKVKIGEEVLPALERNEAFEMFEQRVSEKIKAMVRVNEDRN